jgi:hypothetical protein
MSDKTPSSAATSMSIQASKADVWKKVGFYEHVQKEPNLLLRLSLPVPQEVEGRHEQVGDRRLPDQAHHPHCRGKPD